MMRDTDIGGPERAFPATRHSAVRDLASTDAGVRERAWDVVIAAYWKPVYFHLRMKWKASNEEAKDLTQAFFARMLEGGALAGFDPARAAFRTWLRLCLDGFASNERKAAGRLKRGGGRAPLPLDFEGADRDYRTRLAAGGGAPAEAFDREWTRQLFDDALAALRDELLAGGRAAQFELFAAYDLHAGPDARPTYAELAAQRGLAATQVTNQLAGVRRRLRQIVLDRLRAITASEAEYDDEVRAVLGHVPS